MLIISRVDIIHTMGAVNRVMMSGVEAALRAVEDSDVKLATGVPGFPINPIFSAFQSSDKLRSEWQYNEKIAYEMALGASVTGSRAVVVSKHVGLNVMSDPLIISATHGIGSGIVVIIGDDIGAVLSQNEQDSRWYGKLAEIPVFDPATPQDFYNSIIDGLILSERISAPSIVRITDPVLKENGEVITRKAKSPQKRLDMSVWRYTMYGKHQKYLNDGWSQANFEAGGSSMNKAVRRGRYGIISSGHASAVSSIIADTMGISQLTLGMVNPFPRNKVNDFLSGLEFALICEEPSTFIEEQVNSPKARGRLTGHLPRSGELDENMILQAIESLRNDKIKVTVEPETLDSRGFTRSFCSGCPFLPVYEAIKSLGEPVVSDVGCSIYMANPPFSMVQVACSLGSPVSVACGMDKKGVAMLGDFGLLHTGMQSLLNAKYHSYNVLVVLFVNEMAAMTGGQVIPDITETVKSVFKDDCVVVETSSLTYEKALEGLKSLYSMPGMKIYLVRGKCSGNIEKKD
jgi:indolepyruvate ferredoxin oxidoreductase alpha subunit